MLASAAAGSVLEIGDDVHRLGGLCFFILRDVLAFVFSFVRLQSTAWRQFLPWSLWPDEAQQFTSHCGGDLSFVLACCSQSHVTLVQPVLCLPRNLFNLFRNTLLSFAQSVPDTWGDDDSSMPLRRRFVSSVRCRFW